MRRVTLSPLALFCVASISLTSVPVALATTAPILDNYGTTLTVIPTSSSSHQPAWPRFTERGVDIDGTLRKPVPLGWAVAGDPLGGGYSAGRTLGDVSLCEGAYHPTEIDIALPTLGLPVVIGRTYSGAQDDGAGGYSSYEGYQGWNWNQVAQPQISLVTGVTADLDVLYLIYGNDRFIEFKRTGLTSTEFKAKNGAAGVVSFTAGSVSVPELYTYYDQRGNQITFFGFNNAASHGAGHLWKMVDPAGNTAYVEDASTAATAASNGYDISDRMKNIYDASGRKYLFTYNSFGPKFRLEKVEAQLYIASVWTTIEKVEYDYYTSTTNDVGLAGDLKTVTITHKGVTSGDYVRTKYYRYYTRAWSNSDGRRGEAHQLKMVVGFDGVRQEASYASDSDSTLKPYSEAYFEYLNGDYRIANVTFNGNCGCAGGTSGTYTFTYATASSYATDIADTSYQNVWEQRTVIAQPDGTYVSQYFDETGAVLGRVLTNSDPSGSPTKKWVTDVERNSNGQVTAIHSPANITAYTHSTGATTYSSSVGLITTYTRHNNSDNLDGLRDSVAVKEGTSGTPSTISSVTMADRQLTVGASGVSMPQVDTTSTYPSGSNIDTSYSYTYWSSTASNVLYLSPKAITTTNPTVSTGNNGSNSSTATYRYLRQDGTTVYTKDAGDIIFYTRQTAFGQTYMQIADVDTTSGDIDSGDTASTWSISTSGSAIHAKTTMTYDDQGRILTQAQPSVAGTRTSTWLYVLDSARLGTLVSPLYTGGNYYGPLSYTRVNHAGRVDRRATIEIGSPSGSIPTSTTPNTSANTSWSAMTGTVYDQSGMRATQNDTYLTTSTADSSTIIYDSMGRIIRTADATGTINRTVYDERGLPTERWIGTDDTGMTGSPMAGSSNMVKVELNEYDAGSSSGGGNGLLTKRSQDSTGVWSGGVGDRVTSFAYDYRGRMCLQTNPVSPHTLVKYDNSNRAIATGQYNAVTGLTTATDPTSTATANTGATIRLTLNETAYDQRGQVYQSTRWEINQSNGAKGSGQVTDNWYDSDRRLVKTIGSQITKTFYDRLGRATDRFLLAYTDDSTTYSAALTVSGDLVLEQTHTALDPTTGRALAQWLVQRAHDDTSAGTTGALDTNGDSDPMVLTSGNLQAHARPQITSMWYDDWDRVKTTVQYGTNGGSTFTRTALSIPAYGSEGSPPTYMRTDYAFDTFGRSYQVKDSAQKISQTNYDFAGRKIQTIDNYVNGTCQTTAGTYGDQDRTVDYEYTLGMVTKVTREMPKTSSLHDNDQETTYSYDTSAYGSSVVLRKNLLTRIVYPEQSGGQSATDRDVIYSYNALSQVSSTIDPAGNVIDTSYDAGGRVTQREASTIISGFDTTITKIITGYEDRGMVNDVQQKNGGGTVKDEVSMTYDGWGNLSLVDQDPDSAIGGGGRALMEISWTYGLNSTSGCNRALYLSSWNQPGAAAVSTLTPVYSSGLDADVKRISNITDNNSTVTAEYKYLGAGTVVGMDYYEPTRTIGNWLYAGGGSSDYTSYMDRFNRPIAVKWSPGIGNSPVFIDLGLDYDVQGNNVALTDAVLKDANASPKQAFGMLSSFDALRRLYVREEGELNGGHSAVSTRARIENCGRNSAGRITSDQISLNSDGDYTDGPPNAIDAGEMDDTRTYNKRNELTGRSYYDHAHSPATVTLTYDKNGNLTSDGEKYDYKYNPWGQLVQIKLTSGGAVAAVYTYNGLGQRISEQLDTNTSSNDGKTDDVVDSYDPVFYIAVDAQGRRVATYNGTQTNPKEVFVYHPGGLRGPSFPGGVMLRDRNASLTDPTKWATETASSTRAERNYYCSDQRGNVSALVDNSGKLVEQYRYSPSGVPFGIPLGNVKSDGVVDAATSGTTDYTIVDYVKTHSYEARADLNLDGTVDSADTAIVTGAGGFSTGRGKLSVSPVGNRQVYERVDLFGDGLGIVASRGGLSRNIGIDQTLGTLPWSTIDSLRLEAAAARRSQDTVPEPPTQPPAEGFPWTPWQKCGGPSCWIVYETCQTYLLISADSCSIEDLKVIYAEWSERAEQEGGQCYPDPWGLISPGRATYGCNDGCSCGLGETFVRAYYRTNAIRFAEGVVGSCRFTVGYGREYAVRLYRGHCYYNVQK